RLRVENSLTSALSATPSIWTGRSLACSRNSSRVMGQTVAVKAMMALLGGEEKGKVLRGAVVLVGPNAVQVARVQLVQDVDALGGQDVGLLAAGEVIRFGAVGAGIFAAADAQHTDAPAVIGVPVADGNGYHAAVVRLLGESAATADAAVAGTVPALVAGFAQLFQARAV